MSSWRLTDEQAEVVERARRALSKEHGHSLLELAERIGVLEWHLGEMLALVEQVTGD
jgi:hypothetical protein